MPHVFLITSLFPGHSIRKRQWFILGLFLLVLCAVLAVSSYREHGGIGSREEERLLTQTRIVQENLAWNMESLNKLLEILQRDPATLAFNISDNKRLSDLADAMPGVRTIFVMDAEGTIRVANRPELIGRNLKDRDYFTVPRHNKDPGILYVTPPFKTVLGSFVINVSRTLHRSDGTFAGIVTAALDPEYFDTLLSSVRYEQDMWLYLAHGDGQLFLFTPHRDGVAGKFLTNPDSMLSRHRASGKNATVTSGFSHATNENRMIALRTIQPPKLRMDKPLIVAASRDVRVIFEKWRRDALIKGGALLLFALYAALGLWQYQRRQEEFELRQAEATENINALNDELERFFTLSLDLLCIADMKGHFRRLNRAWEETLGYSLEELTGSRFLDFVHPDDMTATLEVMSHLNEARPVLNFVNRYRCRDGSYRWIEWRSTQYQNRLIYAAARDVTALKLKQQELEESERFMRLLIDIIPGMVGYWTSDLRCKFANISYLEWFGRTPEQMHGIHIRELMGEELFGKNEPFIRKALSGEQQSFERALTKVDGSTGYTWAHYVPTMDGDQVLGFFVLVTDVSELKQAQHTLEQLNEELVETNRKLAALSITDSLTGIANRRHFNEVLAREYSRLARSGAELSLIMLDIDHFKNFNDNYGHVRGDECLKQVAGVITDNTDRAADQAARYGGEEFVCILPETDQRGALQVAERIRRGIIDLAIPHGWSSAADYVSASLGVVTIRFGECKNVSEIVTQADELLYRAKSNGRNRIECNEARFETERGNTILPQLVWKDDYCCGNRLIDSQHKSLFKIFNELLDIILSSHQSTELSGIIARLVDEITQHCHDEETILEEIEFPGLSRLKAEHAELLTKCFELSHEFEMSILSVGEVFQFLVCDFVMLHMLKEDRAFFPYIVCCETPKITG